MSTSDQSPQLALSSTDIVLILKALAQYDQHIKLLNSNVSAVNEDDLAEMNNDSQYMQGLARHLENYRQQILGAL